MLTLSLLIWDGSRLLQNLLGTPSELTYVSQLEQTNAALQPETTNPSTSSPGIGSTITGKDGMTLLSVPAREFTMGSDNGKSDEKSVREVTLDAFWIDQTEVTNAMYARCVNAHQCNPPTNTSSLSWDEYFGNSDYDHYPVIYVTWNDANDYCVWVD